MATEPTIAPNPFAAEHRDDPYAPLAELQAHGPVQRTEHHGGLDTWVVLGHEAAKAALKCPHLSTNPAHARDRFRQGLLVIEHEDEADEEPAALLTSDPPDHTRLRGLVSRAFTRQRAEAQREAIQTTVDALLDAIAPAGEADLIDALAFPLPIIVITHLLGIPAEHRDDFRRWTMEMQSPPDLSDAAERKLAGKDAMHAYLREFIAHRRTLADAPPDLSTALLAAADAEGRLSEPELVALLEELLIGGYETAANFIANALLALLLHPAQRARLQAEPDLLPRAIDELLRYDGSVLRAVPRIALEDVEVGGATIPAGALVTVALGAANRDPEAFEHPHELDFDRPTPRHLAFGAGIHFCPGAGLARLESEIAIGTVLRRFPDLALAVEPGALHWRPAGVMRALEALPVRFAPRP